MDLVARGFLIGWVAGSGVVGVLLIFVLLHFRRRVAYLEGVLFRFGITGLAIAELGAVRCRTHAPGAHRFEQDARFCDNAYSIISDQKLALGGLRTVNAEHERRRQAWTR